MTRPQTLQLHDEQLVERLQAGDSDAFTEIYIRYWKLLFYVARKRLQEVTDAEEAVQNIFTDLWMRRNSISIHTSLKYYLTVAVQYQVMSQLSRRHIHDSLSTQEQKASDKAADHLLTAHELQQQVAGLITALPEKCRLVYQLSRDHGLNNKEIASSLGIAEKTVENQLTKALAKIRKGLGDRAVLLFLFAPLIKD